MASQLCQEPFKSTTPVNAIEGNRGGAKEKVDVQHSDLTQTQTPSQFQFLALPKEVRLMIYGHLPRQIKHTRVLSFYSTEPAFILTKHLPVALLRTCRTIYVEAESIVKKLIQVFIVESRPKIIAPSKEVLAPLLDGLNVEYAAVRNQKPGDLESVEARQVSARIELRGNAKNMYRFFHQAARFWGSIIDPSKLTSTSGNFWVDRVHIYDLKKYDDDIVEEDRIAKRPLAWFETPGWRSSGYVFVASTEQYVPSRDHIPELRDPDNKHIPGMSEETWVREWLPSSDS